MIPNPVNTIATYFAPRSSQYPPIFAIALPPATSWQTGDCNNLTSHFQLSAFLGFTYHSQLSHSSLPITSLPYPPFHGLSFLPFSSFHLQLPRFPKHPHPRPLSNPLNISYNTNLPPRLDLQTRKDLDLASPNRKSSLSPAYTIINMHALTYGPSSPNPDPKSQK